MFLTRARAAASAVSAIRSVPYARAAQMLLQAPACRSHLSTATGQSQTADGLPYDIRLNLKADSTNAGAGAGAGAETQARILEASLGFVPEHGWTLAALAEGSKSLGYTDVTHGLFARGPIELVEYFIRSRTRLIAPDIQAAGIDLSQLRTTARIREMVVCRLKMTQPYIHKWPQAAALLAQPQNLPNTVKDLTDLVDEIWYLAGDRSVDLNWYSKRSLLAGVYTTTEMFMTTDKSPGFEQTYKFLDRRLNDVGTIGRTTSEVRKIVEFGARSAIGILRSRGFGGPLKP